MRIPVLRGCHRLDDIARITWMVIPVVADEPAVTLIRREEAVGVRFERKLAAVVLHRAETLEKPPASVELERRRMFLLVGRIWRRAGGDHDRAGRKLDAVAGSIG